MSRVRRDHTRVDVKVNALPVPPATPLFYIINMLYPQSQQRNEIFRLAHLSDLHLTSLVNAKIRDLLNKRALGYLSWRLRRRHEHLPAILDALRHDLRGLAPDHIVITGDLTHIGLLGECQQARQWLDMLGSPTDVTVVPGNHDTYVRSRWEDTLALWTPYMASDPGLNLGVQQEPGRSFFPSVRMRGPAVLIGATSARPSAPFFATGSLGATQIERLSAILDCTRRQGRFRILLIHHPPVTATLGWRKRLTDGAALRALLARYGVEMVGWRSPRCRPRSGRSGPPRSPRSRRARRWASPSARGRCARRPSPPPPTPPRRPAPPRGASGGAPRGRWRSAAP